MLSFSFVIVLSFLAFWTEALESEDISSFVHQSQRRAEFSKLADIFPLISKLISEMKDMKSQILHEMPEQLEKQSEAIKKMGLNIEMVKEKQLQKQSEAIKKMGLDIEMVKEAGVKQADETKNLVQELENLKKIIIVDANMTAKTYDCCAGQGEGIKTTQEYLKNMEASSLDRSKQISENLGLHDQRLQKLSDKGVCRYPMIHPRDCSDIKAMEYKSSGVYRVYINNTPRDVFCDFNTPGGDWLVFQRRRDGSVDFYRNWAAYTSGFGQTNGDFWLGNEILYQLTSNRRYKLRIDLEDFGNLKRYAEYSSFSIGPASDYYRLKIGTYSGDAGDSLSGHTNHQFSTHDVDRDTGPDYNCAQTFRGAWWYTHCHGSNLNGRFLRGNHSSYADGVNWVTWHGYHYSLKSEMKIALLN